MDLNKILEKYPQLTPDKEGLVSLANLAGGESVIHGYILDDLFIPYSKYFGYAGTSKVDSLNLRFCLWFLYLHNQLGLDCSVRFDLDSITPSNLYVRKGDFGGAGRGIQEFDIELFMALRSPVLSEKIRRNIKFDELFGNHIDKTEFFFDPRRASLQIEEIASTCIDGSFCHRYFHTEFSRSSKLPVHFDGTLLFYSAEEKLKRNSVSLDKKLKNADASIKLFRVDGEIPALDDWVQLTLDWFTSNECVYEWFDPKEYAEEYRDILVSGLDF